jgi:hypothetical protein
MQARASRSAGQSPDLASHHPRRFGPGGVQVLAVERRGVEGGGGEPPPSLACQQLALTIEAPPAQADPPVNRQCPAPRNSAGPHADCIAG